MGKVRVCGGTCHKAKRPKCRCWCGGLFHGTGGREAREAFVQEFGLEKVPTTEQAFDEVTGQLDVFTEAPAGHRWRSAIAAAVAARAVAGKSLVAKAS